jgi:hypothetical protein
MKDREIQTYDEYSHAREKGVLVFKLMSYEDSQKTKTKLFAFARFSEPIRN